MADQNRGPTQLNPNAPEFIPRNEPMTTQQIQYFPISHHQQFYNNISPHTYNNYIFQNPFFYPPPPPPPTHMTIIHPDHDHGHRQYYHDRTVVSQARTALPISNPSRGGGVRVSGQTNRHRRSYLHRNNNNPTRPRATTTRAVYVRKTTTSTDHSSTSSQTPVGIINNNITITTLMIKNIPSKYTREMLMKFVDDHCKLQNSNECQEQDHGQNLHAYDFLYLPIDFRTKLNKGYAFVNFTTPQAASGFEEKTNDQGWAYFNSKKIRKIAKAELQGKDEMLRHYEMMRFGCNDKDFLPVLFIPARDGINDELVMSQTVGKFKGKYYN